MKRKDEIKRIAAVSMVAGFALSLSGQVLAASENFNPQSLASGYMQLASMHEDGDEQHDTDKMKDGKCGSGKCGSQKMKDATCGAEKMKEGKCGSGKCGSDKKSEGSCGE